MKYKKSDYFENIILIAIEIETISVFNSETAST